MIPEYVVIRPVVTEKSVSMNERGCYVFFVHKNATKDNVKSAFLNVYGREVDSVRVLTTPKKIKLVGRGHEKIKRKSKKKVFVSFKTNEAFEFKVVTK
jgi:large subunit ribosomal protein L23